MTDKLQKATDVELVIDGEDAEDVRNVAVEDFSIGFDEGDRDVEPRAMAVGETEYEFSFAFEPSPRFLLWWLAVLSQRE